MKYEEAINAHYGQSDLGGKILAILQREGINTAEDIKKIFTPIEELHFGGSAATLDLAQKVSIDENMKVLDIGCGIGGPARNLVSNFGCLVTGIDLTKEYCRVAEAINGYLGLKDYIKIVQGNALNMPFEMAEFDIVFMQHFLMNIKDKDRIFSQIHNILKPKGRLALHTICTGAATPIYFPVMFANDPDICFLLAASELRKLIVNNGFTELSWYDVTYKILKDIQQARSKRPKNRPRSITPELFNLIFTDISTKWKNAMRNFTEDRWVLIQGIFEKT